MNEERTKRSLKAIFSADVKGYSRLMGEDEAGTVSRLKEYRQVMINHIERRGGRVVDSPGDNILVEFTSVVDAVECAVDVQKELKKLNDLLPEDKKMAFRIGINLGDVIEDGDRIYGDGVNIAARIEGLAEPGGICISGTAFDAVGKKLPLGYAFLGDHQVKNIEKPVRAYRVLIEPEAAGKVTGEKRFLGRVTHRTAKATAIVFIIIVAGLVGWNIYLHQTRKVEPADPKKMAFPLPDKPSIAVLPFVNMSEDKSQEYFSDGLTEEIITALAKTPKLFVIARESSFSYKNKSFKVQQVSEELGVRYVLEGSVRKEGNNIRITAQLIDAIAGNHLWAECYNRELKEVFAIQDEITLKILSALRVKLTSGEMGSLYNPGTSILDAYLKMLEGSVVISSIDLRAIAEARKKFEEAIALDPKFAKAYVYLALSYGYDFAMRINPKESMKKAFECLDKARSLDESLFATYVVYEFMYDFMREYDKAIASAEKALSLAPGSAQGYFSMGRALNFACQDEDALINLEKAIRLNPFPSGYYYQHMGAAYFNLHNHEKAVSALKRALAEAPMNAFARTVLMITYAEMGRMDDAVVEGTEFLKSFPPGITIPPPEAYRNTSPWKDQKVTERYVEADRKLRSYLSSLK